MRFAAWCPQSSGPVSALLGVISGARTIVAVPVRVWTTCCTRRRWVPCPARGKPLSPYAVTKYVNELYADVFARSYGFQATGLRYFNVFGKRQDPEGAYAAVIPKWTAAMVRDEDVFINGDGETSRDFRFIENAVQANLLAATADEASKNEVYNVAVGDRTTLNDLFAALKEA